MHHLLHLAYQFMLYASLNIRQHQSNDKYSFMWWRKSSYIFFEPILWALFLSIAPLILSGPYPMNSSLQLNVDNSLSQITISYVSVFVLVIANKPIRTHNRKYPIKKNV